MPPATASRKTTVMERSPGLRDEGEPPPLLMRRLALLLALLTVAACDSGSDDAPRLSGLYAVTSGTAEIGLTATLTLDLDTSGGAFTLGPRSLYRVAGNGESAEGGVTGSGSYDPPAVTLRLDRLDLGDGFVLGAATFTGTASASGDVLTLTSDDETLTLRRQ